MKTPAEIHAEVGQPIAPHLVKHYQEWEYRAYKKDDIANIIEEAKAEQSFHNDTDESDADVIAAISDMVMDFKPDAESDNSGTILDRVKAAVEYEPVLDAKAEEKGVCVCVLESGIPIRLFTSCKKQFNHTADFKFCPGCGEEIKVV